MFRGSIGFFGVWAEFERGRGCSEGGVRVSSQIEEASIKPLIN